MSTGKFLLIIWGGVFIEKRGPFSCEPERDKAVRAFREAEGDEHGIHWLNVYEDGDVEAGDYSWGFFHKYNVIVRGHIVTSREEV